MEVTATGPLALGTASTGNSGGDGVTGAFASVLGALGAIGTTASAPAGTVPVAPAQTANVPLILGAALVAPPAEGASDIFVPPATGEEAETLPPAPDAQAILPIPAPPETKIPTAGAKPDKAEGPEQKTATAPTLQAAPPEAGEAELVAPTETAGVDMAPETVAELLPQPELPTDIKSEPQVEAPAVLLNDAPVAQVTPQQARPRVAEKGFEAAKDVASAVKPQEQLVQADAAGPSIPTPDTPNEQNGEAFARMVPAAGAERAQPQAQAHAALLPSAPLAAQQAQLAAQPAAQVQQESHPTVSFRSDKMAQEMGLEIARRVSAGGDELVIRMDPAELGRINVRMAVNEQGQLRAIVSADMPAVLEALRSDLSQLNRALEQAGVRTDAQSFRFDQGGSPDPGSQWQQRYQQQASSSRSGDAEAFAMADDEIAYRPMATNGRVNMMA